MLFKNRTINESFLFLLIIPIAQIVLALFIYEYVLSKRPLPRSDISFGMYVQYASLVYIIVVIATGLAVKFVRKTWISVILVGVIILIYDLYLIGPIEIRPNRVKFIIALTNGLLISSLLIKVIFKSNLSQHAEEDENILDEKRHITQ